MSTPDPEETPIERLIEASSFGTPEARAARATVSDEHAARLVARSTGHPEETEREALTAEARKLLKPHEFRVGAKTNYGSEEHSAVDYWGAVKVLADALAARRLSESGGVDLDAIRKKIKHAWEDADGWDEYAKPLTGRAYFSAVGAAHTLNDLAGSLTALIAEVERLRLSESEIRRDQAEKDAELAESAGHPGNYAFPNDWTPLAQAAVTAVEKATAAIRAQFTPSPETEQEPSDG